MWTSLRRRIGAGKSDAADATWASNGGTWLCLVALVATATAGLLALGASAPGIASAMLCAALLVALLAGGRIVRRALVVARARGEDQAQASERRFGAGVARAHDWIRVEGDLRALLEGERLGRGEQVQVRRTIETIERLRETMRASSVERHSQGGSPPPLAGHAVGVLERVGGDLKPYSWTPRSLLPDGMRAMGTQFSMVLDEVRVLHNVEIERAVLLFTLVARAALILLAPLLGSWTRAHVPLADTDTPADAVWIVAAAISLATAARAPMIVDKAMEDSESAHAFRGRLLMVETPVSLLATVLLPAWTVVVFAAGWTNWWQRQTPRLEFDWAKLAIFVAVVSGLQCLGLAIQGIAAGGIALEVVITLTAIAVIGASYGAMLPLALATILSVVVGDGARSIRTARRARATLLDCARQLRATAATIDSSGAEVPLARNAATMSRQAAGKLEREADLFGRRGLLAPQIVAEVFDQAIGISNLMRRGAVQLDLRRRAAAERGDPDPAFVEEPILGPLANARVAKQKHARILRSLLVTAYNEAAVHGSKGVRAELAVLDGRLRLLVSNLPRPHSEGTSGEGGQRIRSLAAKLPGGELPLAPELRPGRELDFPSDDEWWVVEVLIDQAILVRQVE